MAVSYGAASNFTAQFSGPYSGGGSGGGETAKIVTLRIPASTWKEAVSPYTQVVTVDGVSVNSIIDLAADSTALEVLTNSRCVVYLENNAGTVTAVAVGGKPKSDLTLQAIIREGVVT